MIAAIVRFLPTALIAIFAPLTDAKRHENGDKRIWIYASPQCNGECLRYFVYLDLISTGRNSVDEVQFHKCSDYREKQAHLLLS
jgi:hypothetical protein